MMLHQRGRSHTFDYSKKKTTLPSTTSLKHSLGPGTALAAIAAGLCLLPMFNTRAADVPQAGEAIVEKAPIYVLLVGYYIWAKPEYVELCRKEGILIHGPMPKDKTGADPANYSLEFLKQFGVVVASGPLECPWDPQVVHAHRRTRFRPACGLCQEATIAPHSSVKERILSAPGSVELVPLK